MADYTSHYEMITLGPGESLSKDDYAFTQRNITNMDSKMYLGAEGHRHNGEAVAVSDPDTPLSALLDSSSGSIPGGRTVHYKYTWVDALGQETAASPEITVNTPSPVAAPGRPTVSRVAGGTLPSGNYYYALTAYKNETTLETTNGERAYTSIQFGAAQKTITLTYPTLPAGATGFNVYRRSPGSMRFQFIHSEDMSGGSPPATWSDAGSDVEDCNRTVPQRNTTNTSNNITLSLPGATPMAPDGYTWKIYRTYTTNDWTSSLLHWAVEETSEDSGIVSPQYIDVGRSTSAGGPPRKSEIVGSPTKILLTDSAEVEGELPPGKNIVSQMVTFTFAGVLEPETGGFQWICEYDKAQIIQIRPYLGRDSQPAVQDVIIDVNKWDAQVMSPSWLSIFADQADRPRVLVGEERGDLYVMDTADTQMLYEGDALSVDIDQIGDGATPTDYNLVVNILLYVQEGDDTTTWTWADA